jgi:hypothetical protein
VRWRRWARKLHLGWPLLFGRQARRVGDKAVAVLQRVGRERQLGEAKKRCGGSETPRMTVAVANSKAP